MATACDFYFLAGQDGTNYERVHYPVASGVVAPTTMAVGSAMTATWIPLTGFINQRYLKVEFTSACTAVSGTFQFVIS
jgi:hypothetical protein